MAPQRTQPRKTVRVKNPTKEAAKIARKDNATRSKLKAQKRAEEARKKYAERKATKASLQENFDRAETAEEKQALQQQIDDVEKELQENDTEMQDAEADEQKYTKEEEEADKMDVNEENEVIDNEDDIVDPSNPMQGSEDNIFDPDKPMQGREDRDAIDLVANLLKGISLDDQQVPLDMSLGSGVGRYESIVSHKNSLGKVAIIVNQSVKDSPIYRIRRNVVISKSVPNLILDRRAGTLKDEKSTAKWDYDDFAGVMGIAIAVPEGYKGKPEDLVLPVQKFSPLEKQQLKLAGKKAPSQPDVQVLIKWKEMKNGKNLSWESRSSCYSLWKKATPERLWHYADLFERRFRERGGSYETDIGMPAFSRGSSPADKSIFNMQTSATPPFGMSAPGRSLSPGESPDPELLDSNRTTPEQSEPPEEPKPLVVSKPPLTAAQKRDAMEEFKIDWCELKQINPGAMTNTDDGNMMAAFKSYWAVMSAA